VSGSVRVKRKNEAKTFMFGDWLAMEKGESPVENVA
jgi:hypothetical protein